MTWRLTDNDLGTLWRAMKLVSNVPCAPQRSAISCEVFIDARITVAFMSTASPCLIAGTPLGSQKSGET